MIKLIADLFLIYSVLLRFSCGYSVIKPEPVRRKCRKAKQISDFMIRKKSSGSKERLVLPYCCYCAESLSHVWLFAAPWTVALRAPLAVGFPRQEGVTIFSSRGTSSLKDGTHISCIAHLPLSHLGNPSKSRKPYKTSWSFVSHAYTTPTNSLGFNLCPKGVFWFVLSSWFSRPAFY